ncbi:hypothetical protein [Galbibacter sp.]|uniref:hypothetical protein n=1 Tax=Galbibacter sp. TaxID=2918471 RepID=UPI003A93ED28
MKKIGTTLLLMAVIISVQSCNPPEDITEHHELYTNRLDAGDEVSIPPDNEKDADE